MLQHHSCPALLIAAPASGQGKTTLVAALARLHARQGRRVRVFKCGPDFLDPFWLERASGAPVHNLDLWMTGESDCRARLHAAAGEADLILVEGVMGLYDGQPSAADLARAFDLPVMAIVDASAMARTFGAIAHGLQHYEPGLRWAGVFANRVGSARHADMLRDALPDPAGFLGALARDARMQMPERHLGLVAASELPDALDRLDAAADALAQTPLGQLAMRDWDRFAVDFAAGPDTQSTGTPLQGRTVAVARDAAFSFIYAANLDVLRQLGARLIEFSPCWDANLPPCDAVWLPGGYPELHAATIAANVGMREALRRHVNQGRPLWAECGGMMVLFDSLIDTQGTRHAMWGLLPGRVTLSRRLAALGSQQWGEGREALRGHAFHFSTCETTWPVSCVTPRPDASPGEAVYRKGALVASYFHAWFASSPQAVARIFRGEPAHAATEVRA